MKTEDDELRERMRENLLREYEKIPKGQVIRFRRYEPLAEYTDRKEREFLVGVQSNMGTDPMGEGISA